MLKKFLLALVALFILIQFFRPARNNSGDRTHDISNKYRVPDTVAVILDKACNDCHSNNTRYPWYAEVQPVGWWLANHVDGGKRHLNLNSFTSLPIARQKKRMDDCIEQLDNGEMPLDSYTWIHTSAKLSEGEKAALKSWCQGIIDTIKATYPPDSLVLPKRKKQN